MKYVRCIDNRGAILDMDGSVLESTADDLVIGQVYKVAVPHKNDGGLLRVIDASGEDYLYPAAHFEAWEPPARIAHRGPVTVQLDEYVKGVLQAEAVAAKTSVSALLRTWIEDRLDLPAGAD